MPFSRPTLSDLRSQIAADITSGVPGADGLLRFSNMQTLGKSLAGLDHLNYGYLDWIARQSVPFTATEEYLEGWAALKNVYREDATPAVFTVTFPGTPGALIAGGAEVVRSDSAAFTTASDVVVGITGTAIVTVTAVVPGDAGNSAPGTLMSLSSSVTGVQSSGTVTAVVTTGADQELDASLFSRMLFAYQNPPNGGAKSDYIIWAEAVPGVTRAWCNPNGFGVGTVVVYVMLDIANAAYNGFPQGNNGISTSDNRATAGSAATGDQLAVANAIFVDQPVTAMVYLCAPIASPNNFVISGLASASTVTRAAIAAAIAGVMLSQGAPLSDGSFVALSDIESAIAAIASTKGFVITSPVANIANTVGYLPELGSITYS